MQTSVYVSVLHFKNQSLINRDSCLFTGNLLLAFTELLTRFSFQAVANAFFSVDSFFFLR